jgi:hypothetical protein
MRKRRVDKQPFRRFLSQCANTHYTCQGSFDITPIFFYASYGCANPAQVVGWPPDLPKLQVLIFDDCRITQADSKI